MSNKSKPMDLTMNVVSVRNNTTGYTELVMRAHGISLPYMSPGQFVNILVEDVPGVFLRRPISVNDVSDNALTLLVKDAGRGTHRICNSKVGDKYRVLLPLGHGYDTDFDKSQRTLLIGGGVGTAPLLYLGKVLKAKGVQFEFLLGTRTADDLMQLSLFEEVAKVNVATEDGSSGIRGFVTDHPVISEHFDRYYVCGPMPMMKAVAKVATAKGIECEVSLENKMACGLGACLCCVEDSQRGNVCTCTEGPVFNLIDLKW